MHPRPRRLPRDRDRLVTGCGDFVVRRYRELEDDVRSPVADEAEMSGVIVRSFRGTKADID